MISPAVRRVLHLAGVVLVVVLLAGATYQGVATAIERRAFPHPGRLIDVGGHQLHIHCTGEGSPTVLLEAPATGMSASWAWVQGPVAETTRVCSYDRAGLGWSEAGDRPASLEGIVQQLDTLLDRAGERGPYVLAGQGLGAAFAQLFAAAHPGDVAALVLVDAPHRAVRGADGLNEFRRLVNVSPWLARTGVLRATRMFSDNAAGLPEPSAGAVRAFLNRPDHLTRAARELALWDAAVARAATAAGPAETRTLEAAGPERVALLTDRSAAARVATAIMDAVNAVRRQAR